MATGNPAHYVPSNSVGGQAAMEKAICTYVCPSDPTMQDGLIPGPWGGTSYVANAQVFAPLQDESINGSGNMFTSFTPNFADRGTTIREIKDGSSNTIGFMHSYALCGSTTRGSIWGYTADKGQLPSMEPTYQPWARATFLGQSGMTAGGERPFQVEPKPWNEPYYAPTGTGCDPLLPASPHANMMPVLLMDASVRSLVPGILADTWNKACLPNDGNEMPSDW